MRFPTLNLVYFGASAKPSHWRENPQQHNPITPWFKPFSTALPFKLKRHIL